MHTPEVGSQILNMLCIMNASNLWWCYEESPPNKIQILRNFQLLVDSKIVYFTRSTIWIPESESTISLSSPAFKAKDASSKDFCIWPLPKSPRSPPFWAELQSLSVLAILINMLFIASDPSFYHTMQLTIPNPYDDKHAESQALLIISLDRIWSLLLVPDTKYLKA